MTTIATYTFTSATPLTNDAALRVYAAGRYLNNSGAALTPTITTLVNGVAQCSVPMTVQSSAIAVGWLLRANFYFTHLVVPAAGNDVSVGSNVHMILSNAQATATTTGTFVGAEYFQMLSNPYNTYVIPSQQNTFAVAFNLAGGDVLELHESHMEGL